MLDQLDWSQTNFLDALMADKMAEGWTVSFLPFFYGADFLPLAFGTTASTPVVIDADSDFVLCAQTFSCEDAANGTAITAPNLLVSLQEESSQRSYQSAPISVGTCFGTGERPAYYFAPRILPARTSLNVTAQNLSPAINFDLRFTFIGAKAYLTRAA